MSLPCLLRRPIATATPKAAMRVIYAENRVNATDRAIETMEGWAQECVLREVA